MRRILFLALFLYNFLGILTRASFYDYEDDTNKRHLILDERKNWRKKSLNKAAENDHKWESRRRREFDNMRYYEENGGGAGDGEANYRGQKHYEDGSSYPPNNIKSAEQQGAHPYVAEKDSEKKMNCDRPHEKFEACFAGCAAVSCDNPRDRMRPCYPFCEAGCVCIPPYVRDDRTHKCVVPEECTKSLQGIPDLGDET